MIDYYSEIFGNKKKVMVVFAHPDDCEVFAGGTVARLIADGKEVRVVKMTMGNKGSRQNTYTEGELTGLRKDEDADSMRALGVKPENSVFLPFKDGEVENTVESIEKVVKQIRLFRPDILITHNPENIFIQFNEEEGWINHRDHRNTGKTAIDAAYPYSRDLLFFPEHFAQEGVESHEVKEFLIVDYYGHSNEVFIDVTDFIETRIKAMNCHKSQYEGKAESTTEFMTKCDNSERRYERFRYLFAD